MTTPDLQRVSTEPDSQRVSTGQDLRRISTAQKLRRASTVTAKRVRRINLDIDKYTLPYLPRSFRHKFPQPIAHFLGYRPDGIREPSGNVVAGFWGLLGGFAGTAALGGFFMAGFIKDKGGPVIVGSYGAAAILEYNAIESPFAQPRNALVGQLISSTIGVGITKLFKMDPHFESRRWLAGALAVGLSSFCMSITDTIYPPAGATALLAATDSSIYGMGWLYIGIVMISSLISVTVACLINNIQRRFPLYWWTAKEKERKDPKPDVEEAAKPREGEQPLRRHAKDEVQVTTGGVTLPKNFFISSEEEGVLRVLEQRLQEQENEKPALPRVEQTNWLQDALGPADRVRGDGRFALSESPAPSTSASMMRSTPGKVTGSDVSTADTLA